MILGLIVSLWWKAHFLNRILGEITVKLSLCFNPDCPMQSHINGYRYLIMVMTVRYTSQGKAEGTAADKATCPFSTTIMKALLDATTINSKLETKATVPSLPDTPPLGHRPWWAGLLPACTPARSIFRTLYSSTSQLEEEALGIFFPVHIHCFVRRKQLAAALCCEQHCVHW